VFIGEFPHCRILTTIRVSPSPSVSARSTETSSR
jgi:hypothetical protein